MLLQGRVAANILNKQSRTADEGGPPAWRLGEVLTTPPCQKMLCNTHKARCFLWRQNNPVGKPEGKRPLGRPRRRWEDNIKMDLQEMGGGCGDWMELAQGRDRWRALVITVMNLRVP